MRILLLLLAASGAFAAPCRSVDGDRIRAGDLAQVVPAFTAVDPEREISPAPLAGARRLFGSEELKRIAARQGLLLETAPAELCFERAVRLLDPEQLLPILRESLGRSDARIEITDYSRYPVPQGRIEFLRSALVPSGLWRGRVVFGSTRSAPIWVKIRFLDEPPVAKASPAMPAPKEVERGDKVRVEVLAGGVLLAFDSAAESGGRLGDLVMVRNPENGRLFRARVEGKGKVVVR